MQHSVCFCTSAHGKLVQAQAHCHKRALMHSPQPSRSIRCAQLSNRCTRSGMSQLLPHQLKTTPFATE
jgi:hypothetical protein